MTIFNYGLMTENAINYIPKSFEQEFDKKYLDWKKIDSEKYAIGLLNRSRKIF